MAKVRNNCRLAETHSAVAASPESIKWRDGTIPDCYKHQRFITLQAGVERLDKNGEVKKILYVSRYGGHLFTRTEDDSSGYLYRQVPQDYSPSHRARCKGNKYRSKNGKRGYSYIQVPHSWGYFELHIVVLHAWVGERPEPYYDPERGKWVKYECDHFDGNSLNNNLSNLRWLPDYLNDRYAGRTVTLRRWRITPESMDRNLLARLYDMSQEEYEAFKKAFIAATKSCPDSVQLTTEELIALLQKTLRNSLNSLNL